MGITSISRDFAEQPNIVRILSSDTLATVSAANYILSQAANIEALNMGPFQWEPTDMILVGASDGDALYVISPPYHSLTAFAFSTTLTGGPAVVGDFANFSSIGGNITDLGYLPSDSSKTRVVMAGSATVANHIALFQDTTGTIDDTAATAINNGPIQAGLSGTSGYLASYPATGSKGSLHLTAVANTNDDITTISNVAMGQASVISIPDPANALGRFLVGATATPLVSGNFPAASGTGGLVVDSGFGANNVQRYVSVAISAAEWNGMYAAPKLLIAAPGANNLIVVDRMVLVMTFVSAAYADGGVVAAQWDATVNGAGQHATNIEAAADFFAAASSAFMFVGNSGNAATTDGGLVPLLANVDKGLYLSNKTGAFTTGDGTWVAKVWYRIVSVV